MRSRRLLTLATRPAAVDVVYGANYERVPESAAQARRLVAGALALWGLDQLTGDAKLVVTELVANAVAHAQGDGVRVTVTLLAPREVRIGVIDRSTRQPRLQARTLDDERGRGMHLVSALSMNWGVDALPSGKRVWATLTAAS